MSAPEYDPNGFDVKDKAMRHLYHGIKNTPETTSGSPFAPANMAKNLGKFLHPKKNGLQGAVDAVQKERTEPIAEPSTGPALKDRKDQINKLPEYLP